MPVELYHLLRSFSIGNFAPSVLGLDTTGVGWLRGMGPICAVGDGHDVLVVLVGYALGFGRMWGSRRTMTAFLSTGCLGRAVALMRIFVYLSSDAGCLVPLVDPLCRVGLVASP